MVPQPESYWKVVMGNYTSVNNKTVLVKGGIISHNNPKINHGYTNLSQRIIY